METLTTTLGGIVWKGSKRALVGFLTIALVLDPALSQAFSNVASSRPSESRMPIAVVDQQALTPYLALSAHRVPDFLQPVRRFFTYSVVRLGGWTSVLKVNKGKNAKPTRAPRPYRNFDNPPSPQVRPSPAKKPPVSPSMRWFRRSVVLPLFLIFANDLSAAVLTMIGDQPSAAFGTWKGGKEETPLEVGKKLLVMKEKLGLFHGSTKSLKEQMAIYNKHVGIENPWGDTVYPIHGLTTEEINFIRDSASTFKSRFPEYITPDAFGIKPRPLDLPILADPAANPLYDLVTSPGIWISLALVAVVFGLTWKYVRKQQAEDDYSVNVLLKDPHGTKASTGESAPSNDLRAPIRKELHHLYRDLNGFVNTPPTQAFLDRLAAFVNKYGKTLEPDEQQFLATLQTQVNQLLDAQAPLPPLTASEPRPSLISRARRVAGEVRSRAGALVQRRKAPAGPDHDAIASELHAFFRELNDPGAKQVSETFFDRLDAFEARYAGQLNNGEKKLLSAIHSRLKQKLSSPDSDTPEPPQPPSAPAVEEPSTAEPEPEVTPVFFQAAPEAPAASAREPASKPHVEVLPVRVPDSMTPVTSPGLAALSELLADVEDFDGVTTTTEELQDALEGILAQYPTLANASEVEQVRARMSPVTVAPSPVQVLQDAILAEEIPPAPREPVEIEITDPVFRHFEALNVTAEVLLSEAEEFVKLMNPGNGKQVTYDLFNKGKLGRRAAHIVHAYNSQFDRYLKGNLDPQKAEDLYTAVAEVYQLAKMLKHVDTVKEPRPLIEGVLTSYMSPKRLVALLRNVTASLFSLGVVAGLTQQFLSIWTGTTSPSGFDLAAVIWRPQNALLEGFFYTALLVFPIAFWPKNRERVYGRTKFSLLGSLKRFFQQSLALASSLAGFCLWASVVQEDGFLHDDRWNGSWIPDLSGSPMTWVSGIIVLMAIGVGWRVLGRHSSALYAFLFAGGIVAIGWITIAMQLPLVAGILGAMFLGVGILVLERLSEIPNVLNAALEAIRGSIKQETNQLAPPEPKTIEAQKVLPSVLSQGNAPASIHFTALVNSLKHPAIHDWIIGFYNQVWRVATREQRIPLAVVARDAESVLAAEAFLQELEKLSPAFDVYIIWTPKMPHITEDHFLGRTRKSKLQFKREIHGTTFITFQSQEGRVFAKFADGEFDQWVAENPEFVSKHRDVLSDPQRQASLVAGLAITEMLRQHLVPETPKKPVQSVLQKTGTMSASIFLAIVGSITLWANHYLPARAVPAQRLVGQST